MSGLAASYGSGASLFLAATLLLGGTAKAASVRSFALTLRGLVGPRLWHAPGLTPSSLARLVIALELGLGAALVVAGRTAALAACNLTALLFAGLLWAVLVAMRKGINCGCFGRLAKTPAGPAEVARTSALGAIAVSVVLVRRGDSPPPFHASTAGFAVAGLLAAAVISLTELAGSRSRRVAREESFAARLAAGAGLIQALAPRPRSQAMSLPGRPASASVRGAAGRPLVIDPASPLITEALVAAARADGDYDLLVRSATSSARGPFWESALAGQAAAAGEEGAAFVLVAVPAGSDAWLIWSPDLVASPTALGLLSESVITVEQRRALEQPDTDARVAVSRSLDELPVLDRLREVAETAVHFACTAGMAPAAALCRACATV